jgi:hypothetical protein
LRGDACSGDHGAVKPRENGTIYVDFNVAVKHHEASAAVFEAFEDAAYPVEKLPPLAGAPEWLNAATLLSFFGGVGVSVTVRLGERVADKALDAIAGVAVARLKSWLRHGKGRKATVVIYGPNGEKLRAVKVRRRARAD